jgi:LacI family transcriptional regulator
MAKKISIRDIGKELGISITTVSFVLNGKAKEKRISEALTKKILDFVEKVNFKPNVMAQGLRTGRSKIICLMVEDISKNALFAQVARHIEEQAHTNGYRIIYCSTGNKKEKASELIQLFQDRSIDGYIITPPEGIEADINDLIQANIPVVLIDRTLPGITCNHVVVDNFDGAYQATSHLIENGCKSIAIITSDSAQNQMQERLDGYQKAIANAHLPASIQKLNFHDSDEDNIKIIMEFITNNPATDALFFTTNYIGSWGLQALKRLNLRIPQQISVVSFDDTDLFRYYTPAITVVAQPISDISHQVMSILLKELGNDDHVLQQVILPTKLIVRESSLPQKNA